MISKRMMSVCMVSLACLASLAGPAFSTTYEGSLSDSNGGLNGAGKWASGVTLTWTVTNNVTPPQSGFLWKYTYTLSVAKISPSHIIIEASNSENPFSLANITSIWGANSPEIKVYSGADPSNPGMPSTMYGMKFEGWSDAKNVTLSFYSNRVPVWGDFYSKGGSNNYVYNAGFTADDPIAPTDKGSLNGHLLIPDTKTEIPEPSLLTLLSVGGFALLRKHRR